MFLNLFPGDYLHHLVRLDLPTLYACHLLICLVAGMVFVGVRPSVDIRGLRWIAANFFLDTLFLLLMLTRSEWRGDLLGVLASDLSLLFANYAFYVGFCMVMTLRPRFTWIRVLFGLSIPLLLFFSAIKPSVSLRWGLITFVTGAMHLVLATQAMLHTDGPVARKPLAGIEYVTGMGALYQGLTVIVRPMAQSSADSLLAQAIPLFLQLLHVCGVSLCALIAVHERVAFEAKQYALQDALPGVLNRKGIELELLKCLEGQRPQERPLVIALIDLDHFKKINDDHGHPAGDAALAYLAEALTARLRPSDNVGRIGGDEFLILLPDANVEYARDVLEAVRREVSDRRDLPFTLSCGGTTAHKNDTTETILKRADDNLYRVKRSGRNQIFLEEVNRRCDKDRPGHWWDTKGSL